MVRVRKRIEQMPVLTKLFTHPSILTVTPSLCPTFTGEPLARVAWLVIETRLRPVCQAGESPLFTMTLLLMMLLLML